MRSPAHATACVLFVASSLLATQVLSAEPTFVEANTPLTAVSKHASYVFASTPNSLFRAPLETKRWERLKTPSEMPLNGTFASQPGPSSLVIYVAMRRQTDQKVGSALPAATAPVVIDGTTQSGYNGVPR